MKDETQEAAENYGEPYRCPSTNENEYCKHDIISAFNNGAKWQAERMYSELEVIELLNNFRIYSYNHGCGSSEFLEWFEQFKKK